jgi:hypothetical protein
LTDFVALYRGRTVSEAQLVAVSAEPRLVRRFFVDLLDDSQSVPKVEDGECQAPIFEVVRDE